MVILPMSSTVTVVIARARDGVERGTISFDHENLLRSLVSKKNNLQVWVQALLYTFKHLRKHLNPTH